MTETARTEDAHIGRVVADKYRIDAVVGAGASGTVYRAMHLVLERPVALKVLAPALLSNETARARFRREARAASKLDHPNSVQVLDYGIEPDGLTYLAMELLEGRELFRAIYDDWPLGTERTVRIMTQVLAVLSAAHDAGIVHRDLKPENIMLVQRPGDDGQIAEVVKVADFGIAKTVAGPVSEESMNLTRDGAVHGTPEYMSPEQARSDALDGRADLYACGCILYEMMTGTLPFTGDGPFDVILKHLTEPVVLPSARRRSVDRRLEPVVMRALAKIPADRFPDARAMRAALLAAAAEPVATLGTEPPTPAHASEPPRNVRRLVATIAVSVAPPAERAPPEAAPTAAVEQPADAPPDARVDAAEVPHAVEPAAPPPTANEALEATLPTPARVPPSVSTPLAMLGADEPIGAAWLGQAWRWHVGLVVAAAVAIASLMVFAVGRYTYPTPSPTLGAASGNARTDAAAIVAVDAAAVAPVPRDVTLEPPPARRAATPATSHARRRRAPRPAAPPQGTP